MRTLWLDLFAGCAGDMLCAALLDAGANEERWRAMLARLGLEDVEVTLERTKKCGIGGLGMKVHHHEHHPHRGLSDVLEVARRADLPAPVMDTVTRAFTALAEAEAEVHQTTTEEVHFHEVGAVDAIVDVVSAAFLLHDLGVERIEASPVRVGQGSVTCAHGLMPVPAPATALLLRGVPTFGGESEGEFCTPTGAALLKATVERFGGQPALTVEKVGAGAGTRDAPFPNLVRAFLGASSASGADALIEERLVEVECHIDDMDGQALAFLRSVLLQGPAVDVSFVPVSAKKDRPGQVVKVLAPPEAESATIELLLLHSSTLGVRVREERRVRLPREEVTLETSLGPVRAKKTVYGGHERLRPEHDDLARLAREAGRTLQQAREAFVEAARKA